ncbi:hypothetical protein HOY80DRAFT_1014199 [Tuber brumale]|nr:hypothetical protein HOY80DRAFT_1014199 [Tuber brumale]
MPSVDRSACRYSCIYSSHNRATVIGSLLTAPAITNANLYSMLETFCILTNTFVQGGGSEQLGERDGQQLQPGTCYIVTSCSIAVTNEAPLTPSVASCRDAVRNGTEANLAPYGYWLGFEDTHDFPLAHEAHWDDCDYAFKPLDQTFLDNPVRPVDDVLRWHYCQAVLVNMKWARELCFEVDVPPGSKIMGEIMSGPNATERMEFELFCHVNSRGNYS